MCDKSVHQNIVREHLLGFELQGISSEGNQVRRLMWLVIISNVMFGIIDIT